LDEISVLPSYQPRKPYPAAGTAEIVTLEPQAYVPAPETSQVPAGVVATSLEESETCVAYSP
jgi:hypothetical protein